MAQAQDPASGINSWLEDELYHQYQFDRGSVDRGWVDVFNKGAASPSNGNTATTLEEPPAPSEPAHRNGAAVPSDGPPVSQQDPPAEVPPAKEPPSPVTQERQPCTGEHH